MTGIRQDAYANANRIVPEVEKEAHNKGRYLHADAWAKKKGVAKLPTHVDPEPTVDEAYEEEVKQERMHVEKKMEQEERTN